MTMKTAKRGVFVLPQRRSPPRTKMNLSGFLRQPCRQHGTCWGRKNLKYKNHPQFRMYPTFETATSRTSPAPEEQG
jgi:hypothetical protein